VTCADEIKPIAPPVPAPYLTGLPHLRQDLLDAIEGRKTLMQPIDDLVQAHIYTLAAEIQFRRQRYENEKGVKIVIERRAGLTD
jgi:hypothetical protein